MNIGEKMLVFADLCGKLLESPHPALHAALVTCQSCVTTAGNNATHVAGKASMMPYFQDQM